MDWKQLSVFALSRLSMDDDENHRGRRVSDSNKCTPDIDTFYKRFPLKRSLPRHPPNNLRQFEPFFSQTSLPWRNSNSFLIIKKTNVIIDLKDWQVWENFSRKKNNFLIDLKIRSIFEELLKWSTIIKKKN